MGTKNRSPQIAIFDIETGPMKGYAWRKYESDMIHTLQPTIMLSFAWKWMGEKKVRGFCLPDYPAYKKNKADDSALVKELWNMMDEADIIVAHNGDKFDIKKTNARFLINNLKPPSPYRSVDTLKIARSSFGFDSNKLDDLARYLGIGKKLPHTGTNLWVGCMDGEPAAWKTMRKYNIHDVELLEPVYLKIRPWAKSHPDLNAFTEKEACPRCQSLNTQRRGPMVVQKAHYQKLQCMSCGHWFKGSRVK